MKIITTLFHRFRDNIKARIAEEIIAEEVRENGYPSEIFLNQALVNACNKNKDYDFKLNNGLHGKRLYTTRIIHDEESSTTSIFYLTYKCSNGHEWDDLIHKQKQSE